MSEFKFLASEQPLPVLDLTGLVTMKVKEIKKLDPLPSGPVPWDELDDELEVRYTANESAMDALQIAVCKYPPDGLDAYISYIGLAGVSMRAVGVSFVSI